MTVSFVENPVLPPFCGPGSLQRNIFDALQHGKNCILTGDAGSGKTRIFFEVARLALQDGYMVAVVEDKGSLTSLEHDVGRALHLNDSGSMHSLRNSLYKAANTESFWILLDNFTGKNQAINHFLRMLAQLSCPIAVSFRTNEPRARRAVYRSIHTTEVYRIQPLESSSANELAIWAKKFFELSGQIDWKKLPQSRIRLPGVMIGTIGLLREPGFSENRGYLIRKAYIDFRTRILLNGGRWGLFQEHLVREQVFA